MKLYNTGDNQNKPSLVMMCYGEGGVGKTTFASTAPAPIIADCEGGAKYFGLRGIKTDVAQIESWSDMKEFLDLAKSDKYQTVVIDPIGELMDKLKRYMIAKNDSKLVQKDGSPTMAGWGWLKKTMRDYVKVLRDCGKNIIIVAHIDEKVDEDKMIKRPMIETKISAELVNMVDVVGYMTVINDGGDEKRVIIVDPSNDKYTAKDRTGQLGKYIPPNFSDILDAVQGNKKYKWAKNEDLSKNEPVSNGNSTNGNNITKAEKTSTTSKKHTKSMGQEMVEEALEEAGDIESKKQAINENLKK